MRSTTESTRKRSEEDIGMDIRPVRTRAAYRAALKEIESLMRARRNTAAGERLDVLVTLVEAYEREHFSM